MNQLHPLVALFMLYRLLSQLPKRGGSMPSLTALPKPAQPQPQQQQPKSTPQAQGSRGIGQGFQGEKGPIAAARSLPTQLTQKGGAPTATAQRLSGQPNAMPGLAHILAIMTGTHK